MSSIKVINDVTKDIFTPERLVLLRDAVVEVFDVFQELLQKPVYSYADVRNRLDTIEDSRWEKIRARFLDSEYTGIHSTEFSKEEKNTVVYILLKFIRAVDRCTKAIVNKLEAKDANTLALETQVRELEVKLRATDGLVQSTKTCYSQKCSENSGLIAQTTHLQEVVNEKNRKIHELEKDSNVMLWEKEKKRILKESEDRIKELETELSDIKSGREDYKRRMSNIDESHKRMMMKQQILNQRSPAPSDGGDSDDLCRKNFILDKDVSYLEKELYDLQTNTVGVIGGMKTDFNKLTHKFLGDSGFDKEFDQLSCRMDQVYHAVSEGKMEKMREALPPHYRYIENTNFRVKRIRRLSQTAVVPPQRILNAMIEDKTKPKPVLNDIGEVPEPLQYQQNPVIMITKTKKLHPINPIKYFPHMSQQFIIDQYDRFTEFDSNHDENLDLTEMVKVVTQLGFSFNAHQLQEAMEEVDKDHNHTLDFYEYLLIIDNIYKRHGKAELFKQGLNELNKKNMSKACVIQ